MEKPQTEIQKRLISRILKISAILQAQQEKNIGVINIVTSVQQIERVAKFHNCTHREAITIIKETLEGKRGLPDAPAFQS